MKVLGIDPGSTVTAFGVVQQVRGRLVYQGGGFVRTSPDDPMGDRLARIHGELTRALHEHEPDAVAIEAIFSHRSATSALVLGQARGVALLAASQCGHDPVEYNAMTVKSSVGAHGRADKKAVRRMVELLLGTSLDGPDDLSDALAIAITHCAHARVARLRGVR